MGEEIPEPGHAARQAALAAGWSHRHRDVSGGWLRPTVFGAVDGLVTNSSLIAGLGGGGVSAHTIVLTGVAALVAGAFSMGTGEYVSVTNQNELVHAEVATERRMHARFPDAEQAELAETFRGYGADPETAARMAAAVSRDPDTALRVHTREELGVDPFELPSAIAAGVLSLIAFSAGALIPLLPYLAGLSVLPVALGVAAVALLAGGMVVGRLTGRPMLQSGLRQLALGGIAVAVTFAVGSLIGGHGGLRPHAATLVNETRPRYVLLVEFITMKEETWHAKNIECRRPGRRRAGPGGLREFQLEQHSGRDREHGAIQDDRRDDGADQRRGLYLVLVRPGHLDHLELQRPVRDLLAAGQGPGDRRFGRDRHPGHHHQVGRLGPGHLRRAPAVHLRGGQGPRG